VKPVIPAGMADLLFRSRCANVGHVAEGSWLPAIVISGL
jgi:hypothetical protein